jgi:hypothetical protein
MAWTDLRDSLEDRAAGGARPPVETRAIGMEQLAGTPKMWADPVVLLGVGEEQIPVVAVFELREAGRDSDQRLLDTAEAASSETSVYANTHLLATPRRRDPSGNVIGRASLEG